MKCTAHKLHKMAYAIFGDSFVSRLQKFTKNNFNFKYECKFYGVPGMSTRRKFQTKFEELLYDRPR